MSLAWSVHEEGRFQSDPFLIGMARIVEIGLVRTAGLEPALPEGKEILSLQRLPFRHVRAAMTCHHRRSRDSGRSMKALFKVAWRFQKLHSRSRGNADVGSDV
jgi:hypothetical protein